MKTIGASLARFFGANGMTVSKDGKVLTAETIEEMTASAEVSDMVTDALHAQLTTQAAANEQIVKDNSSLKGIISALEAKITAIEKSFSAMQAEQKEIVTAATLANTAATSALEQAKANADYINKQQGKTPQFEEGLPDDHNPMVTGDGKPLSEYGEQSEAAASAMERMRKSVAEAKVAKQNMR